MKLPYENELYELRRWIDFTNANLQMQFLHTPQEIQRVHQWINAITMGIQADYPFYTATLPRIASILFIDNGMGAFILNQAAFGELVIIIRHIEAEPVAVQFWSDIHPRIVNVSHDLYVDGHYLTAAEKAVYKDVIFDTSPVAGNVYKNSENRRKQGVSCGFRCICRCSICPVRAQPWCARC